MADYNVKHASQVVRAPHYDLYAKWPRAEILLQDTNVGYGVTDTFTSPASSADWNGWAHYNDTGCTIAGIASEPGIVFTTDTTDNDELWIQAGGGVGGPFEIQDSSPRELIFCAEFKVASIADSVMGVFVGLGEPGLAAADTITDAGALADKDLIGFFRPEGDGDGLDFVFRIAGGSVVTHIADAVTLVADTYVVVGFKFDGKRVIPFYNGAFDYDNTITNSTIAGATFPDGEEMNVLAGCKNGGAAASNFSLRFIECQQKS